MVEKRERYIPVAVVVDSGGKNRRRGGVVEVDVVEAEMK